MTDRPTYAEAMTDLNEAINAAVRAADNEDGAPVEDLRKMAADIDSLIDHGCTRAEIDAAAALWRGMRQAGMVS